MDGTQQRKECPFYVSLSAIIHSLQYKATLAEIRLRRCCSMTFQASLFKAHRTAMVMKFLYICMIIPEEFVSHPTLSVLCCTHGNENGLHKRERDDRDVRCKRRVRVGMVIARCAFAILWKSENWLWKKLQHEKVLKYHQALNFE